MYRNDYRTENNLSEEHLFEKAIVKVNERFINRVDRIVKIVKKYNGQTDA